MACASSSSSSSLCLAAINTTLEDPPFATGSEVAVDALKKALKDWCGSEGNGTAFTTFTLARFDGTARHGDMQACRT